MKKTTSQPPQKKVWGHKREGRTKSTKFSFNATQANAKHLIRKKLKGVKIGKTVNDALKLHRTGKKSK